MKLLPLIFLLAPISTLGQLPPDSIVIITDTYVNNFEGGDELYGTKTFSILRKGSRYLLEGRSISSSEVSGLLRELNRPDDVSSLLIKYGLDTNWIKSNPSALIGIYSKPERVEWNERQKEFIFPKLTDMAVYREELDDLLSGGSSYTMHSSYKNQYTIRLYLHGRIYNELKSRKHVWGYKMPWTNQRAELLYNFQIEAILKKIIGTKEKTKEPIQGNKLLKYLVDKIIDRYMVTLYKLSPYTYQNEIDELKTHFQIISSEEVYGRGRYIWDEPKTMKIELKSNIMYPNVSLIFLASKYGNTIYPRDSVKKNYQDYVTRIQKVKFISDYLKANPAASLDIYFFNNRGINEYNINAVNKNPVEWKKHDEYTALLRKIDKFRTDSSFDTKAAIDLSQKNYCGCNYRFERSYIEQAIFFELEDEEKNTSIWFLMPDNKALLYLMDDKKAFNFKRSDFTEGWKGGLIFPCTLFDSDGNKISR